MRIAGSQLLFIAPHTGQELALWLLRPLNDAMERWGITSQNNQAAFLATLAWKSHQFRRWRSERAGWEWEGCVELGNVYPGDGPKYKEGGPLPIVGRALYTAANNALGLGHGAKNLVRQPRRICEPEVGFNVAGWYWNKLGLNELAEEGSELGLAQIASRLSPPGERIRGRALLIFWRRARKALGVADA